MKIILPPPLTQPPPQQSFWHDFKLLFATQLRVTINKMRHWPIGAWLGVLGFGIGLASIMGYLGFVAYSALTDMPPEIAGSFLSMIFMMSLAGQIFFGITAAFATLYMSEDLELLFVSPVPLRAVFAVKSLIIAGSNFLPAFLFAFLPGIFLGLLFKGSAAYYLLVLLVGLGLWLLGTALAELLNMVVMRIVPPHRSREAIGVIGALAGILIALLFQLPGLIMNQGQNLDIGSWLAGQQQLMQTMSYLPWGWASQALTFGITGDLTVGTGWGLLILIMGIAVFMLAFTLVERGFRRGWVALSQGAGGRRRKSRQGVTDTYAFRGKASTLAQTGSTYPLTPNWHGMWAVAKKDLLYLKRDSREWFGYLVPLILMLFFIGQFLFFQGESTQVSMIMVLIMYSLMFSGNMALQAFGREGESDWFLNSVPLAGWPVVLGKLIGAVIPTLFLMEALLAGTALAIGVSFSMTLLLALGAVLLSLGASSIGLFYSINNSRYNPDSPQHRISMGASMIMYLINMIFMLVLGLGLLYLMPPDELIAVLPQLDTITMKSGFFNALLSVFRFVSKPLLWQPAARITIGLAATGVIWAAFFFGFLAATVRQSKKGFRVELVAGSKKRKDK